MKGVWRGVEAGVEGGMKWVLRRGEVGIEKG